MENLFRKGLLILFTVTVTVLSRPSTTVARTNVGISFQVFYDNLAPYGRWINDRQYGNIWVPDAERDFQPYASRGHWIQTGYGNTWVSDYSWGWAPFHYGRWVLDDYYGWAWIPGDEWGPGWVDWRSGGGYYGWAPMGPSINISINLNLARWFFVPQNRLCEPDIYNYRVYGNRGNEIYGHTTIINNYYTVNNHRYAAGPRFEEIQRVTNRPVRVYNIQDDDRPGRVAVNRGNVNIYRPSVDARADNRGPARVANARPDSRDGNRYDNNTNAVRPDSRSDNANDRGRKINWEQNSSQADNSMNRQQNANAQGNDRGNTVDSRQGNGNDSRWDRPDRTTAGQQQNASPAQQQNNAAAGQQRVDQQRGNGGQYSERRQAEANNQADRVQDNSRADAQRQQTDRVQDNSRADAQRQQADRSRQAEQQRQADQQQQRQAQPQTQQRQPEQRQPEQRQAAPQQQPQQQSQQPQRGSQGGGGRPSRVG